jgi:hypothetical protein
MQRHPTGHRTPKVTKLPPKRAPKPALKPQPRVLPKQHRGGR